MFTFVRMHLSVMIAWLEKLSFCGVLCLELSSFYLNIVLSAL